MMCIHISGDYNYVHLYKGVSFMMRTSSTRSSGSGGGMRKNLQNWATTDSKSSIGAAAKRV